MKKTIDMATYRFGKSIGIMLVRPITPEVKDLSFMSHIGTHNPDIIICISTPLDTKDMYEQLSDTYVYNHIIHMDTIGIGMIFSRYPVFPTGMLSYHSDTDTYFYNITTGPCGAGLNIVYSNSNVLSTITGLSDLWISDNPGPAYFYVDHEYMVAKNLDIVESGDESAMRHPEMKIVYYNFRIGSE